MGASPALKKEILTKKLSTQPKARVAEVLPPKGFDRNRLVTELLSLGHTKINPDLAQLISHEVEAELRRRPSPQVSAELISEILQFKLEELGVIEFQKAKKKKMLKDPKTNLASQTPPLNEEEETVSYNEVGNSRFNLKSIQAKLPTLEKFIRPASPDISQENNLPVPPKAGLRLSSRVLPEVKNQLFPHTEEGQIISALEELFDRVAQSAAEVENRFPSEFHIPTLAVGFFNAMANQEFYPHLPGLLGDPLSPAYGAGQVWMPLSPTSPRWQRELQEAQEIWKHGNSVVFGLDAASDHGEFTVENFEKLMEAIEKAILDLPENVEIPRLVGLNLNAENPLTAEFVKIALSGKYYPRFAFNLGLTDAAIEKFTQAHGDGLVEEGGDCGARVLEKILRDTWKKSEPSLVFLSRIHGASEEAVRPGGGPALVPHEVCNLGSLNLSIVASGEDVDWVKLRRMIRTAVHFLDNLIEVTAYPTERVAEQTLKNRKIGLGVMGFAELLVKLGIPYDSEDSVVLAEKLMRFIHQEAALASENLAKQRGEVGKLPRRNASLTAVVASPILASLADVTPGFEPLPAVVEAGTVHRLLKEISQRRKLWNDALEAEILEKSSVRCSELAPKPLRRLFITAAEVSMEWQLKIQAAFQKNSDGSIGKFLQIPESDDFEILREVLKIANVVGITQLKVSQNPSLETLPEKVEEPKTQTVELEAETQDEIPAEASVDQQEEFQEQVNVEPAETAPPLKLVAEALPEESPAVEETAPPEELIAVELTEICPPVNEPEPEVSLPADSLAAAIVGQHATAESIPTPTPRERPEVLQATSRIIQTGCGPMAVNFSRDEKGPYEMNARLGKAGGCANAQTEAISRLVSLLMSLGVDSKLIYHQLRGIRCPVSALDRGDKVLSCADAISKVFERELGFDRRGARPCAPTAPDETPDIPHRLFEEEEEITVIAEITERSLVS